VERTPADLDVATIAIDEAKVAYIEAKGVTPEDVTEVLKNRPKFFVTVSERRQRPAMIGPNERGRFLLVPIQHVRGSDYRLVSAFWLNRKRGERIYEDLG
jgi:hypothetical protein